MERGRRSTRAVSARRGILRTILASALALAGTRAAFAQRVLATPRGAGAPPWQRANGLPLARDLAEDARRMRHERKPLLLFFDREECPYCEQALREYLLPMATGGWGERALFRQVEIDRALPLIGFDGRETTHRALAEQYDAVLSPTVVVVGPDGERLADPLVGLMVDFYGAYLETALAEGAARLRGAIMTKP